MNESPGVNGLYRLPNGSHIPLELVTMIFPYRGKETGTSHVSIDLGSLKCLSVPFDTLAEAVAFADELARLTNEARRQHAESARYIEDRTAGQIDRIILILSQIRDHE